jgi:hypothetical protein
MSVNYLFRVALEPERHQPLELGPVRRQGLAELAHRRVTADFPR